MTRAVVAGDPGSIDAEHHGQRVEPDVVDDLVPGPIQEGGVHRHDGSEASHRHAGGRGDRVLLGDADVEATRGEALGEREQAGGTGHAGGERDDLGSRICRTR